MENILERPYRVEYSKSQRSKCVACKMFIAKDTLRFSIREQSPKHDGKIDRWFHNICFFRKQQPKTIGDFENFENIRWEHQKYIKNKIAEEAPITSIASTSNECGGRKRSHNAISTSTELDLKIEYADEDDSICGSCDETISEGDIRLSIKDYESEGGLCLHGLDRWHHVECFAKMRSELQFFDEGTNIPGATSLSKEDNEALKKALPKIKEEDLPPVAKKIKPEHEDSKEAKDLKDQQKKLFSIRDKLEALKKNELTEMLETNSQGVPVGHSEILDALADAMLFGALEPCPKCRGQLVFKSGTGYTCTGGSSWAKCDYITQDPHRKAFEIPEDLTEKPFVLEEFEPTVQRRLLITTLPSKSDPVKKDVTDSSKIQNELQHSNHVDLVIKTEDDQLNSIIEDIQNNNTDDMSQDFTREIKEPLTLPIMAMEDMNISRGDTDSYVLDSKSLTNEFKPKVETDDYMDSSSGKKKRLVKGCGTVEPDSGLEEIAHVYQTPKGKYNVTLGLTDIQGNTNKYYKMQIIKHDDDEKYWFFRKWGRIGTDNGGNKLESMTLEDCIGQFEKLFEKRTGNAFWDRNFAPKEPGKYLVMPDSDHIDSKTMVDLLSSDVESKLKKPIQDLMRLIFDVNSMKKFRLEYEIDEEKMPLGKISQDQIISAQSVLSELSNLIKNGVQDKTKFIGLSNRFYTLIPHNFSDDRPPIIDSETDIQAKSDMLESLSKIEIAYKLVQTENDVKQNPLDAQYEHLKTNIKVLDHESDEFKLIVKYVKNTHAKMHDDYELAVEHVFSIDRHGEESRYEPFKKLHNRKLLWHGTRVTNFAGILLQGLRIAPPEVPNIGAMFGRGIYFADLVSKSANYCIKDYRRQTALVLLCDVALGNMYECCKHFKEAFKIPEDCHSTCGLGKVQPDPAQSEKLKTDIEVPCGPIIPTDIQDSEVENNEFIVYNEAQVKIEYIVQLNFLYKKKSTLN